LVYAINIADRFVISTFIEPIKRDLELSDSAVAFLTGPGSPSFTSARAFARLPGRSVNRPQHDRVGAGALDRHDGGLAD